MHSMKYCMSVCGWAYKPVYSIVESLQEVANIFLIALFETILYNFFQPQT